MNLCTADRSSQSQDSCIPSDKPPEPPASEDRKNDQSTVPLAGCERPPDQIGPYRILEQIGEEVVIAQFEAEPLREMEIRSKC